MTGGRPKTGILIFAHGSRVEAANGGVRVLADRVRESGEFGYVEAAFLEMTAPDLVQGVADAVRAGVERVIVVPYFLTAGTHLRRDLPELVKRERLLKLGAYVVVSARRVVIHLPVSFPFLASFRQIALSFGASSG